jgi:hypothetical protein
MRKPTALWSFTLLVSLVVWTPAAQAAAEPQHVLRGAFAHQWNAPPQAAQAKNWKTRDEYDAFNAMATEKDANEKISLAEAFLQKYSNSDFKDAAYVMEMQTYQQLNQADKAVEAGHMALEANPENLDALRFLSFVFPFAYNADDPEGPARLSRAESDAKHGLEVLQKLQKPAGVSDEQFNQALKGLRAVFNGTVGFVALQRKDYAAAVASYKAASEDNPGDWYVLYRMGLAYLSSNPDDYDHGIWYIARALALAQAARDPNAEEFDKYLKQTYIGYHGNDQGLQDIVIQAASSVNPPDGFKVAAMEAPKHTGNPSQSEKPTDFRKTSWGITRQQVKAAESSKLIKEDEQGLFYSSQLSGFGEVLIGYIFAQGKLVRANYASEVRHTNSNAFIEDFDKVKSILTEKYGKPESDDVLWLDDLYKHDPDNWGMAVSAGHLVYEAVWKTKTTKILEKLKGDNFDIALIVQYTSLELGGLEEAKDKEKQNSEF